MTTVRNAIERAVDIFGSERLLARACDVTQSAIWKAKQTGLVSVTLAKAIHRATSGKVPGSELRPDVWRLPRDVPIERRRATARNQPCPKPNKRRQSATMANT